MRAKKATRRLPDRLISFLCSAFSEAIRLESPDQPKLVRWADVIVIVIVIANSNSNDTTDNSKA